MGAPRSQLVAEEASPVRGKSDLDVSKSDPNSIPALRRDVAALAAQLGELLGAYLPGRGTPLTHYIYSLSARRSTLSGPPTSYFHSASVGRQAASRETADALYVIACRRASAVARLAPLHSFG
ncbi:hypothetical protein BHE74_00002678 [Ensete ventricosum]|nr:hypothetical protein BHE74_00002678 [Ensete ventricosum]